VEHPSSAPQTLRACPSPKLHPCMNRPGREPGEQNRNNRAPSGALIPCCVIDRRERFGTEAYIRMQFEEVKGRPLLGSPIVAVMQACPSPKCHPSASSRRSTPRSLDFAKTRTWTVDDFVAATASGSRKVQQTPEGRLQQLQPKADKIHRAQ
jgi:hypothetical protein